MSSSLAPALETQTPFPIPMTGNVALEVTVVTESSPEPWRRAHLAGLLTAHILAAGVLAGAWFGVSDELVFTRQIAHLDAAVVAVMASGVGNVIWIGRARSAVRRRKARFVGQVAAVFADAFAAPESSGAASLPAGDTDGFLSAPRMRRYHRPGCPLLDGKDARPVSPVELRTRAVCGICRPHDAGAGAGQS